jgi:hypothetical protein
MAGTTSDAFESAPPIEPQLAAQVIDADYYCKARKIIGKEDIDGVRHYLVDWFLTLAPKHSLRHVKELVDEFEAQLREQRRAKSGRRGPGLNREEWAVRSPLSTNRSRNFGHGF